MFEDCYVRFNENKTQLVIGNSGIEKTVEINGAFLRTVSVMDKKQGVVWTGEAKAWQRPPVLYPGESPECSLDCFAVNDKPWIGGHLKAALELKGKNGTARYEYIVFPKIPFIFQQCFLQKTREVVSVEEAEETFVSNGVEKWQEKGSKEDVFCNSDTLECIPLTRKQMMVESYILVDKTDMHDCLVEKSEIPVYFNFSVEREGNIFCIKDYPNKNALLLVKHSPLPSSALNRKRKDLEIQDTRYALLRGTGVDEKDLSDECIPCYASAIGAASTDDIWEEFWRYSCAFSKGDPSKELFVMSNTWGDCNADMAVCEHFILGELDRAHELGVDIMQIDDGWENGVTSNARRKKGGVWENFYGYDGDFWTVNTEKFPHGLEPVMERAREYGIKVGLWFGPDSSDDFANVDQDIETLWRLYRQYGVEYFKLDGVKIRSKLGEARFIRMLRELTERSNGKISFNLDVTAEDRFGYLYEMQYGTLFVENRYTDRGTYFPHNTFKNLWSLSKVVLPRRLQMEILNPRRNANQYAGIPFEPNGYSMDYLFATVMPANPLAWMELSHLGQEDGLALSRITSLYRMYRKELFESRIIPIGDCPNGMNFSGYLCLNDEKTAGHLILFREETMDKAYSFMLPFGSADTSMIYQSGPAEYAFRDNALNVKFENKKSFIWLRFENACSAF